MDNIDISNLNNGAENIDIPGGSGGNQTGKSNDFDPIMEDIDATFGNLDSSSSLDSENDGSRLFGGDNINQQSGAQQADETAGMTPAQLAAFFQSKYDKLNAEYSKVKPEYEKYKNIAEFVNQVYEDPDVKQAFLAEVAPELYKPADPYESLQEQLKKEFGEDFTPDDDEAARPLTKSWRYYKRVDELYKDLSSKQNNKVPKTLKELREARIAAQQAQQAQAEQDKAEIMQEMGWTEADWNDFVSWVPQLKAKHLAKWRQHMKKRPKSNAPNLVNQFGGHTVNNKPQFMSDLDKYFG